MRRRAVTAAILLVGLSMGSPTWAEAPAPDAPAPDAPQGEKPRRYQGAYWGLQAHVGMISRMKPRSGELPGPVYGLSFRFSTLASLIDLQATVLGGHYTAVDGDHNIVPVNRLSVGFEGHTHPFLTLILRPDLFARLLSGFYMAIGLDFDAAHLAGAGRGRWELGVGWHLGGGTDLPLTDPDKGWGLWLGVGYRLKLMTSKVAGLGRLDEHVVLVTLGYRNNDIFFGRLPPPEEVRYRDAQIDDY